MNQQLKDKCMEVVYEYMSDQFFSKEEAVDYMREVIEDYMDSHPRLKVDTSDWDFEQIFNELCDGLSLH